MSDAIEIQLPRRIDRAAANDIAARIRSALRNGQQRLTLRFSPDSALCSSEFLGWLVSIGKHVAASGGALTLCGLSADNRRILDCGGMGGFFVMADDVPSPESGRS